MGTKRCLIGRHAPLATTFACRDVLQLIIHLQEMQVNGVSGTLPTSQFRNTNCPFFQHDSFQQSSMQVDNSQPIDCHRSHYPRQRTAYSFTTDLPLQ